MSISRQAEPPLRFSRLFAFAFHCELQFCSFAISLLDHLRVKRTADVRLRGNLSDGKFIVITIQDQTSKISSRTMLYDLKHPVPSSLINCHLPRSAAKPGSNAACFLRFISVNQRSSAVTNCDSIPGNRVRPDGDAAHLSVATIKSEIHSVALVSECERPKSAGLRG